jgi:glycosyltransferase involved in cell wall biosynthesis
MALYREVKRQSGCPVTVIVRKNEHGEAARQLRERQGQGTIAYSDVVDGDWDGGIETGRAILAAHSGVGAVHVFSGYQVSEAIRQLIGEAHASGLRTVVYDEAPCPVCVGIKAVLKRCYYRWVLPLKVRKTAKTADLFLNASGRSGERELMRLGWAKEKIIPFGYASEETPCRARHAENAGTLRVLHTGVEAEYRDVKTLVRAVASLAKNGLKIELRRTRGSVSPDELTQLYEWADVFVACGLCEPWGMRVNDAIHAGLPVVVSDGMGVSCMVDEFGCGYVYKRGNVDELADILGRMARDGESVRRLESGVKKAHAAYMLNARARVFLEHVMPE